MKYSLRYHPKVKQNDIPKLDQGVRATLKRAIEERLQVSPSRFGKPLQRTLKGYWKLRVADYRVVYRIRENVVQILAIIHRNKVYGDVKARIGE